MLELSSRGSELLIDEQLCLGSEPSNLGTAPQLNRVPTPKLEDFRLPFHANQVCGVWLRASAIC